MTMMRRVRFENRGNKYKMRCNFCYRPASELYQIRFVEGGPSYMLHPGNCVKAAYNNYKTNVANGVTPTIRQTQEDLPDQVEFSNEDNIDQDL